jgi:hypothetical protein
MDTTRGKYATEWMLWDGAIGKGFEYDPADQTLLVHHLSTIREHVLAVLKHRIQIGRKTIYERKQIRIGKRIVWRPVDLNLVPQVLMLLLCREFAIGDRHVILYFETGT